MSMSDHERALLVTGTLDTSGVGGSPYANLDRVAVAFGAEVSGEDPAQDLVGKDPGPDPKGAEQGASAPAEPVKEKPASSRRAPSKKTQAPAPDEK